MKACKLCAAPSSARYAIAGATILECCRCSFRFLDYIDRFEPSAPTQEEIERFQAYAEKGLEANRLKLAENSAMVRQHVPQGRLLDVGCGAGGFLLQLTGYDAMGLDPDPVRAAFCRQRGLTISQSPLDDASWDAMRFDAITLWDVIEHVNDPAALVRRAAQLLKPGGCIFMDTPSRDGLLYRFGELTARLTFGRVLGTMGIQYAATPFGHKQIFRKVDMRTMLEAAGFGKIQISEKFELSFPPEFYMKRLVKSPLLCRLLTPAAAGLVSVLPVKNKMIVVARA